jgi:hypothetical protein
MNRVTTTLAIPGVLLASGCAPEETMEPPQAPVAAAAPAASREPPSAAVYDWSDVPAAQPAILPSSSDALLRWALPAQNPWAAYQKLTLLAALDATERAGRLPDVEQLAEVRRARESGRLVASAGMPPATLWIVDLRGAASVAFGATVSSLSQTPVSTILTFHNWPADNETVPAEETLAALVTMSPSRPSAGQGGTPIFLLDAWRLTHRYDRPDDETTDNRYMLMPSDLPDTQVLRARGIGRVLYVVDSLESAQEEEDDVHPIFLSYQGAGIDVAIVDLADLESMANDRPLLPYYGQTLVIDPGRMTILSDPSFFHRARGGFGGTHIIYGGGAHGPVFGGHGGG